MSINYDELKMKEFQGINPLKLTYMKSVSIDLSDDQIFFMNYANVF